MKAYEAKISVKIVEPVFQPTTTVRSVDATTKKKKGKVTPPTVDREVSTAALRDEPEL